MIKKILLWIGQNIDHVKFILAQEKRELTKRRKMIKFIKRSRRNSEIT